MAKIAFVPSSKIESVSAAMGIFKALTNSISVEYHSMDKNCNCITQNVSPEINKKRFDHIVLNHPDMSVFDVQERFALIDNTDINYAWEVE